MKFETSRFGEIHVPSEKMYVFPEGLLGFSHCTRFTFIDEADIAPFRMLQSLDKPSLAFIIIDPTLVQPKYHFKITKDDLKIIKGSKIDNLALYSIVTMSQNLANATVNLQGPLIVNPDVKLGFQFILYDEEYTTKERLLNENTSASFREKKSELKEKAG